MAHGSAVYAGPPELFSWIRGLERWNGDLAIWAYSEATQVVRPIPSTGRGYLSAVAMAARHRLESGDWPEWWDYSAPTALVGGAHEKALRLALGTHTTERRYLAIDHPEVVSAGRRIRERYAALEPDRWSYNHVERGPQGWTHVFRYERSPGRLAWLNVQATESWEPEPGLGRGCPDGRAGVFDKVMIRASRGGRFQRGLSPRSRGGSSRVLLGSGDCPGVTCGEVSAPGHRCRLRRRCCRVGRPETARAGSGG